MLLYSIKQMWDLSLSIVIINNDSDILRFRKWDL